MIIVKFKNFENLASEKENFISQNEFFSGIVNWQLAENAKTWTPPCDLFETENSFLVRVEVAGMNEKDFEITIDHHHLVINGKRYDDSEFITFHQMEIFYGEFSIDLELPPNILTNKVTGEYLNGFLLLDLPKAKTIVVPISRNETF